MKANKSNFINMVLTLTIIALVAAFILSYVEQLTKEPISRAKDTRELEAIASVIKEFDNDPFAEKLTITSANKKQKFELYPARKDGVINSYAIKTFSNNGFGGKIEMIVGFLMDGSINNFIITQSSETPGLGTKISDEKFKSQFRGLNPNKHGFKVRQDGGEIDAVTAATISSRAAIDAIKKAAKAYNNFNTGNN